MLLCTGRGSEFTVAALLPLSDPKVSGRHLKPFSLLPLIPGTSLETTWEDSVCVNLPNNRILCEVGAVSWIVCVLQKQLGQERIHPVVFTSSDVASQFQLLSVHQARSRDTSLCSL